jgi:Ca2+-binding EF-hand superfamily protein
MTVLRLSLSLSVCLVGVHRGEIDAVGFRQMAWVLGEDLSESEAQACVARLDLDGSGGLSLPELRAWYAPAGASHLT